MSAERRRHGDRHFMQYPSHSGLIRTIDGFLLRTTGIDSIATFSQFFLVFFLSRLRAYLSGLELYSLFSLSMPLPDGKIQKDSIQEVKFWIEDEVFG